MKIPVLDPATPSFGGTALEKPLKPSAYWGDERIWYSQDSIHNPMLDEKGRVWMTSRVRPPEDPAYCQAGSPLESGWAAPAGRPLSWVLIPSSRISTARWIAGSPGVGAG